MARKTVILTPEDAVVTDLTLGYQVFTLSNSAAKRCVIPWDGGVPTDFSSLYSVELIMISEHAGNLYLRGGTSRFDLSTASTPNTSISAYAAYAGGAADSTLKYLSLPSTMWSSISTVNIHDAFNFHIDRDGTSGTDTYEADLKVIGIRVVYNTSAVGVESYDIIALSDAKDYLKISGTTLDTVLQQWISWLSLGVEDYCARKFAVQTVTGEIRNGDGLDKLTTIWSPLNSFPTGDTTQDVMYRDSPSDSWTVLESDANNILIDPENPFYILLYENYFPVGIQNIKVNYKAGYDPIPSEVIGIVLEMVTAMWKKSKQGEDLLMIQSRSRSEAGINFSTGYRSLMEEHRKILNTYRRITF